MSETKYGNLKPSLIYLYAAIVSRQVVGQKHGVVNKRNNIIEDENMTTRTKSVKIDKPDDRRVQITIIKNVKSKRIGNVPTKIKFLPKTGTNRDILSRIESPIGSPKVTTVKRGKISDVKDAKNLIHISFILHLVQ